MSLVADYGSSSEDSNAEDESGDKEVELLEALPPPPQEAAKKLPLPGPDFVQTTSVFSNPFAEAEAAKRAILERHVKMVPRRDNLRTINGKKICWNYRRNRCRFGRNCAYAHDSDLQKTEEQLKAEQEPQETLLCRNDNTTSSSGQKRKRPGLSRTLTPCKKVMKDFYSQQQQSTSDFVFRRCSDP